MNKEEALKIAIDLLEEPLIRPPKFCNICGGYSSKKHQGVWCEHCPGKMVPVENMTMEKCIRKTRKQHGSGWVNGFYCELCEKLNLKLFHTNKIFDYAYHEALRIKGLDEEGLGINRNRS